jgi:hypothetical protein
MAKNKKRADSYNLEVERLHTSLRPKSYTASEAHRVLREDYNLKRERYKTRSGRIYSNVGVSHSRRA